MENKNDAQNYADMSVPHSSPKALSDAFGAFLDDVAWARKKHRIQDVVIISAGTALKRGKPSGLITRAHLGNGAHGLRMAVWNLEQERAAIDAHLETVRAELAKTESLAERVSDVAEQKRAAEA